MDDQHLREGEVEPARERRRPKVRGGCDLPPHARLSQKSWAREVEWTVAAGVLTKIFARQHHHHHPVRMQMQMLMQMQVQMLTQVHIRC